MELSKISIEIGLRAITLISKFLLNTFLSLRIKIILIFQN